MRLIGMMNSPFVRRVAVSLRLMELPFEHEHISLFRQYEKFAAINPVVKAPTLITDEGVALLDSTLILEYLERLVPAERRLTPVEAGAYLRSQRILGLALAACEKSVQIVYETSLRPDEKRHQPWLDRVHEQLCQAYRLLEEEIAPAQGWLFGDRPLQADITSAVAFRFTAHAVGGVISPKDHPAIMRLSERAEALAEFLSSPLT